MLLSGESVSSRRDAPRDGGLLSYGTYRVDMFRCASSYVNRILHSEKPGGGPVQFPTKFERP